MREVTSGTYIFMSFLFAVLSVFAGTEVHNMGVPTALAIAAGLAMYSVLDLLHVATITLERKYFGVKK